MIDGYTIELYKKGISIKKILYYNHIHFRHSVYKYFLQSFTQYLGPRRSGDIGSYVLLGYIL